ncbi:MAG: YhjD/YihY/BrkB family envelope integrity protein [Syntrophus sp. (in: bacteria)]
MFMGGVTYGVWKGMRKERISHSSGLTLIIIRESIQSFLKNNSFEMSAALATYGFFSLIPLLFFVSYLMDNYALWSHSVTNGIEGLINHIFPLAGAFSLNEFFILTKHTTMWGIITLCFVFISIMSLTDTMRTAFQKIFSINNELSLFKTQGLNARSAAIILVLFFCLVGGEIVYATICREVIRNGNLFTVFNILLSLAVPMFCMIVFYKTFLPIKFNLHRLVVVSLVSAILIVGMRELFTAYLHANPDYAQTFGSLRMIFIMILWVYYCFLVTLFGAEIMVNFKKREALLLKGIFLEDSSVPGRLIRKFIMRYHQGDTVFQEGEKGNMMFYVLSGSINILKKGQILRVMKKGDYFGEMAMLIDTDRTATAIAVEEDTKLVCISRDNFDVILTENPKIVFAILKEMTMRLKITDDYL